MEAAQWRLHHIMAKEDGAIGNGLSVHMLHQLKNATRFGAMKWISVLCIKPIFPMSVGFILIYDFFK